MSVTQEAGLPPLAARVRTLVRRAVARTLWREGWGRAEVCVHLGHDGLLRRLNRRHRGIDAATDVLSFCLLEPAPVPGAGPPASAGPRPFLGDVVISRPRAERQAARYGHGPTRELCYLAVHGTLHLLGYDDADPAGEAAMAERARAVLDALGVGR